jgi:hypothetical protein
MPVGWAIAIVVIAVVVLGLTVLMLGVLRQVTPLLEAVNAHLEEIGDQLAAASAPPVQARTRLAGLSSGDPLPAFTARTAQGKVTNTDLLGKPVIMAFLSAGCKPCQLIGNQLGKEGLGDLADRLLFVTTEGAPAALGLPPDVPALIEDNHEVSEAFTILGTPFAVAVDAEGVVRGMTVPNSRIDLDELSALLN